MIVTHIRKNSDASEKELEALALFMGHSVSMVSTANSDMYYYIRRIADNSMTTTISNSHIQQRESYDRRTLEQKIEPAIQIMQQMIMPGED